MEFLEAGRNFGHSAGFSPKVWMNLLRALEHTTVWSDTLDFMVCFDLQLQVLTELSPC